jgi:hypothetical protein
MCIASDIDLDKINPNMSDFDQKIEIANQAVRTWMKNPMNRAYLDEKKADYIHTKGFSSKKGFKHELDIPPDAFIMLPIQIRNNQKELLKWAKKYHPYLFHNQIT